MDDDVTEKDVVDCAKGVIGAFREEGIGPGRPLHDMCVEMMNRAVLLATERWAALEEKSERGD